VAAVSEGINYILGPVGALVLMIVVSFCLLGSRRPVQALAFATVTLAGWLAQTLATIIVRRPQPPAMTPTSTVETGIGSFPSLHTSFAAALVVAVALVLARGRARQVAALGLGLLFIGCVGFAAVYVGLNYLTDVIASLLVVVAAAMSWLPVWNNVLVPQLNRAPHLNRNAEPMEGKSREHRL
jgi:undecaprenyl-diphosphatase